MGKTRLLNRSARIAVFIAVFASGFLFVSRSAYQTGDSLSYLYAAKIGDPSMFHSHHLAYSPVLRLLYLGCRAVSETCEIIPIAQAHNVVWAVVALLSLYFLAVRLTGSLFLALTGTATLLISNGFLMYATQAEVYVPALGALALLTVSVLSEAGEVGDGFKQLAAIVALLSVSVLYHQTNVLLVIPIAAHSMFFPKLRKKRVLAVIASGGIVLTAYVLAYAFRSETVSFSGFVRFCLSYSYQNPSWGTVTHFSISGLENLIGSQLWNVVGIAFGHNTWENLGLGILMLFPIGWNLVQSIRNHAKRSERMFFVVWFMTYHVFFLWWLPSETEFFIVTLFPMILLWLLTFHDIAGKLPAYPAARLSACVLFLTLVVVFASRNVPTALLIRHVQKGTPYWRANEMSQIAPDGFAFMADYHTLQNLKFYFDRKDTVETVLPLLSFYMETDSPTDDGYSVATKKPCLLAYRGVIEPKKTNGPYDSYSKPAEWLRFMEWLFKFEYSPDGRVSACRQFRVVKAQLGKYVVMGINPMKVNGLPDLFSRLDRDAAGIGIGEGPFAKWLRTAPQAK